MMRTAGFSVDQVEQAMMATVCNGGDLHDALDWLCLNLPNGKYRVVLSSLHLLLLVILLLHLMLIVVIHQHRSARHPTHEDELQRS